MKRHVALAFLAASFAAAALASAPPTDGRGGAPSSLHSAESHLARLIATRDADADPWLRTQELSAALSAVMLASTARDGRSPVMPNIELLESGLDATRAAFNDAVAERNPYAVSAALNQPGRALLSEKGLQERQARLVSYAIDRAAMVRVPARGTDDLAWLQIAAAELIDGHLVPNDIPRGLAYATLAWQGGAPAAARLMVHGSLAQGSVSEAQSWAARCSFPCVLSDEDRARLVSAAPVSAARP